MNISQIGAPFHGLDDLFDYVQDTQALVQDPSFDSADKTLATVKHASGLLWLTERSGTLSGLSHRSDLFPLSRDRPKRERYTRRPPCFGKTLPVKPH